MENRKAEAITQYLPQVGREVLNALDELVPPDQDTQAKATIKILKHVETQIHQQASNVKDDLAGDIQYIIVRLVRGLASDREHARHGNYTTLQMMLQLFPQTLSFVVTNIEKTYEAKDTTEIDMVGEVLGWGAIVRSGRLKEDSELQDTIANRLLSVRKKKSYLVIITTQFLVNLIEMCNGIGSSEKVWGRLEHQLNTEIKEPSDLWLKLVLARKQVQSIPKWLSEYKITPDCYSDICGILMQTAPEVPKVHPVLNEVIRHLSSQNTKEEKVLGSFWNSAIRPQIKNHGSEQQLGFIIAKMILSEMKTQEEVEKVVSKTLIKSVISTAGRKDPESLAVTQTLTNSILQIIKENKENSGIQTAVVLALISKPGSVRFDKLTGTRLLLQANEHLSAETIKDVSNKLLNIIQNSKDANQDDVIFTVSWLGRLVTHQNVMASEEVVWRGDVISTLMKTAFFSNAHPKLLEAAKDSFFKCLNHPTRQLSDYLALLQIMLTISGELLSAPSTPEHKLLGKKASKMWTNIQNMLTKLKCEENTLEDQVNKVFQVLYYQMGIQLFNNPAGAVEMVAELDQCFKNATKSFTKAQKVTTDKKEPVWLEVIVDMLVSLLSQNNHFWRMVVQVVFRLLCPYMTPSAFSIITDVLNPEKQEEIIIKEGEEHQQLDEDDNDESDDDESDDDDDESSDDDGDEDETGESDEASEVEESEDESEDDSTDNEENIFEIQKKMLSVLGDVDTEVDMDSVPDSEFRLIDKKLGALLSQYISKNKKKKGLAEDETAMMHFRTRVCDLLDIYVKEAQSMSLMIGLVVPLLKIIRSINSDKRQKDLHYRLRSLLTQLAKVKKFKNTDGVSVDKVVDELEKIFQTTSHMPQDLSDIVGGCYSFLHNCGHQLLGEDAHKLDNPMVAIYRKHLDAFFSQKDLSLSVQAYISPLLSANGGMWSIASLLINHSFNVETRLFRRTQALQLLLRLYQNSPALAYIKEEEMISIEQEISKKSQSYISSLQQASDVKVEYMSNMLDLLRTIHMYHAKSDGMNWEILTEDLVTFRKRVSFRTIKSVNAAYHRLAHAIKLPQLPKASNLSIEEKKKAKAEKKRKREEKEKKYKNKKAKIGDGEGKTDIEKENNLTKKTNEQINTPDVDKKSDSKKGSKSKKRKTDEFYENRKLRLGAKTFADLDEFNFAQAINIGDDNMEVDTVIEEPVNRHDSQLKKKKGKNVKRDSKLPNHAPVKKKKREKEVKSNE